MGTYHRPSQQYHRRRLGANPPPKKKKKHAEHRARYGVSLPSCLQTLHIHVGLFNWYSCLHFPDTIQDCHLLPRFPPMLLGAAFSTPAFSVAPFIFYWEIRLLNVVL